MVAIIEKRGGEKQAGRTEGASSARPARRIDLDRLRVAACLSTFAYHAIQVFDLNPYYHLKSNTPSPALDVAAHLLHAVRMPLFFFISGMVGFAVALRVPARQLIWQRAVRLLPPFALGIIFLAPIIKYYELLDGRSIRWNGLVAVTDPLPSVGLFLQFFFTRIKFFSWSHMWFPLYLLIISALLLPVLYALGRTRALPLPAVQMAAIPLALLLAVELVLRPIFPFHIPNLFWDWASVSVYVICFISGAALMQWPELEALAHRRLRVALGLALGGAVLYVGGASLGVPADLARYVGRGLWLWACLATAIGAGPWLRAGRIPGEAYLSEGALPIYVLHHVPLILIAWRVKDLPWPIWQRYGLIVAASLAATLLIYHVLVRPYDRVRFLFGMPPQRIPE
jgi:glucans biosynthesis protein C